MYSELKEIIGQAWENRELLKEESVGRPCGKPSNWWTRGSCARRSP